MATKNTVKNWFLTGLKPTQTQFHAFFDSIFWKGEKIPVADIEGISEILDAKAEAAVLDAHLIDTGAHAELFLGKEDKRNKGIAGGYAPLDEFGRLSLAYLKYVNDLVTGGYDAVLTAEQGKLLQEQINGINTLLSSDDINLDTVQEIVDAIKTVETSLETILVNDLTTGGVTKALTAEMGKLLGDFISDLSIVVSDKQDVLVPGVNLKTINGQSLLGAGDVIIVNKVDDGIKNKLLKYNNIDGTRAGNSRITDDGENLGIDVEKPTGDLSFGNSKDRTFKVEDTDANTNGRSLTIQAGGSAEGVISWDKKLLLTDLSVSGINRNTGDVYMCTKTAVYKQTNGEGEFILQFSAPFITITSIAINKNTNDVYIAGSNTNNGVYKQTGGLGDFVNIAPMSIAWFGVAVNETTGDVYATIANAGGKLYKQAGGIGALQSVGISINAKTIVVDNTTNNVYIMSYGNILYKQTGGTGALESLGTVFSTPVADGTDSYLLINQFTHDVFLTSYGKPIHKQVGGVGSFIEIPNSVKYWSSIAVNELTGDLYATEYYGLYKQAGGNGDFISQNAPSVGFWKCIAVNSASNSVYAAIGSASGVSRGIYKRITTGVSNLNGGALELKAGIAKGTGESRIHFITSQKTTPGSANQVEVIRGEIDELGNFKFILPTYNDNSEALAGGLGLDCIYKDSTGNLKTVY
ncbi:hypothetical protein ACRASX_10970 [Flavobacterium sp. TMP13]|uniref:hypothetical protein n=1 Tax=Flavobacterium sp. TMP13 TaxID=3425950 RepID=UPI003D76A63F